MKYELEEEQMKGPRNVRWRNTTLAIQSMSVEVALVCYRCPVVGLVVELHDSSKEQYAVLMLSLYVEGIDLAEDEFVCQNYGLYAEILRQLITAGLIEHSGRSSSVWFAEPQPVCWLKFAGDEA